MTTALQTLTELVSELRSTQASTNQQILIELKRINDGFLDYRQLLHERFNKIHETTADVDERLEKLEQQQQKNFASWDDWKVQQSRRLFRMWITGTLISTFLAGMLAEMIRRLLIG